jgi:hypothetical protein
MFLTQVDGDADNSRIHHDSSPHSLGAVYGRSTNQRTRLSLFNGKLIDPQMSKLIPAWRIQLDMGRETEMYLNLYRCFVPDRKSPPSIKYQADIKGWGKLTLTRDE